MMTTDNAIYWLVNLVKKFDRSYIEQSGYAEAVSYAIEVLKEKREKEVNGG